MLKKKYVIPEVQQVALGLPKSLCDVNDPINEQAHIGNTSASEQIGDWAPARVKLYF